MPTNLLWLRMVRESMEVVRLQYISRCGKGMIKVRRKYAESKAHVRLKYGKSTVKYGKSIVLYGNFFGAYCKLSVELAGACILRQV